MKMSARVQQEAFGQTKDGRTVTRYTLSNSSGSLVVKVIDLGCIITEIHVPDRSGKTADINLGYDDVAGFESNPPYLGAVIGRFANRIAGAQFTLDGKTYKLFANDGPNALHGGKVGFTKKLWSSKAEGDRVFLKYVSPDGEEGYPGELTTTVTYRVTDKDELFIDYEATTTQATPINLTNHAYFNLAGHNAGRMDDHYLSIMADRYTPLDDNYLPTGEIAKVDGTILDLRKPVNLAESLLKVPGGLGYVTSYCLPENASGQPQLCARAEHRPSGRFLECYTTEPGLMFYTSALLDVPNGKGGAVYGKFGAFCLEAQHYPDSINQANFPNTILRPGETYRQTTIYKFGVV